MSYTRKTLPVLFSVVFVLLGTAPAFSESIEDGYITRTESSVILKNGTAVKCNSMLWLTKAADFLQCDQDGACTEIKIDHVDMEKTFGREIAKEYNASRSELKDGYAKEKEKMKGRVVTYENEPRPGTEEEAPSASASQGLSSPGKEKRHPSPKTSGPVKVKLTPEKRQTYEAELKRCQEHLNRVKSAGPPETLPGHVRIKLMKNGIFDMKPEEYWERQVKEIEDRCDRCRRRLEGYMVQEPRSVSAY